MRRTTALAALTACCLVSVPLAAPAGAARKPVTFTDLAGDANAVNDQGISSLPVPEKATAPAQVKSADILSLAVRTLYRGSGKARKAKGVTITMALADVPDQHTLYKVDASVPGGCAGADHTSLSLVFYDLPGAQVEYANCSVPGNSDSSVDVSYNAAEVDPAKRTITWTVSGTSLKGKGLVDGFQAQSTVFVLGVVDQLRGDEGYTYR